MAFDFVNPSPALIESLRAMYPAGTRVALVNTNDQYTNLRPGDRGTVDYVDTWGMVRVKWDTGSNLGMAVLETDRIEKVIG